MKVWQGGIDEWGHTEPPGSAVSIGVFDGVHRGHQHVLHQLVELARRHGFVVAVLTFDIHPLDLVAPDRAPRLLTTLGQRLSVFEHLGVDLVGILRFAEVRQMTPDVFAKRVLGEHLLARLVAVGADFRYGMDRTGSVATLARSGEVLGFEVAEVDLLTEHDGILSSTRVRRLVTAGEVEEAAAVLGRPFQLVGTVVLGDGRGRTLGYPTANLEVEARMVTPGHGVYAGWAEVGGGRWKAAVNVGVRPTFDGHDVTIEAHLLDFSEDLYGQEMRLDFVARLRDEIRFPSVEKLVERIEQDVAETRKVLDG